MILTKEQLDGLDKEALIEHISRLAKIQDQEIQVDEGLDEEGLVKLYLDSVVQPSLPDAKAADVKQIKMLKTARFECGFSAKKAGKKYFELKDALVVVGSGGITKKTADALIKDGLAEWVK